MGGEKMASTGPWGPSKGYPEIVISVHLKQSASFSDQIMNALRMCAVLKLLFEELLYFDQKAFYLFFPSPTTTTTSYYNYTHETKGIFIYIALFLERIYVQNYFWRLLSVYLETFAWTINLEPEDWPRTILRQLKPFKTIYTAFII